MARLSTEIKHPLHTHRALVLTLNTEQALSLFQLEFPIIWIGKFEGQPVKIVQKRISQIDDAYEFEEFPKEWSLTKEDIIRAIDRYFELRFM